MIAPALYYLALLSEQCAMSGSNRCISVQRGAIHSLQASEELLVVIFVCVLLQFSRLILSPLVLHTPQNRLAFAPEVLEAGMFVI